MSSSSSRSSIAAWGALLGLGLPGILSLLLVLPDVPGVPRAMLLVGPLVLLAAATSAGAWAAPRVGLASRIASRVRTGEGGWLPEDARRIALAAVGAGALVALVDHATRGAWQAQGAPPSVVEAWSPGGLGVGLLYGGIVEELLFRWGLVSVIAWMIWRPTGARPAALVVAVVLASLAFGAGHLPALAAGGAPLGPALVARTVGLNGVIALGLGGLFARRDLESAMIAHAMLHVGFALVALASSI